MLEIWRNRNAATVLFYPGTMLAPGHYSTLISELWQAGLTVAGLHLSGHGHCLSGNDFTFAQLLGQGLMAETWLARNGFGPILACGHSQGGIFTLAHAANSHTLAGAFALGAVFPVMPEAIALTRFENLASHRQKIMTFLERLSMFAPGLPVPLPLYLKLHKIMAGRKRRVLMGRAAGRIAYPLKFLVSLFKADSDSRLKCPFWLFNARNDALFTDEITARAFDLINAPEKHLIWLENGGHMAPLNPDLACFIARHIAAAASGLGLRINCSERMR